jgi:hypothetical protein
MYSDDIPSSVMEEYENQLQTERNRNMQLTNNQMSMFNSEEQDNLIRYQLDLKEELDKIYHLLKGDIIKEDDKGNIKYESPEDDNLKPFNEFGVQLIMNIMSFYLNRNTLLSNYDEETIKWKILDFGNEISDLILCRYTDMMMTTSFEREFKKEYGMDCTKLPNKRYAVFIDGRYMYLDDESIYYINSKLANHLQNKVQLYTMIVQELCDTIHSAYLRALDGGERESLRSARVVNESVGVKNNQNNQVNPNQKKFSIIKPSTWI